MRTHHLHVTVFGGEFWEDHLLFRDYLRAHPAETRRYEALKRGLAATHRADRGSYTAGKSAFIRELLVRARAWRVPAATRRESF